MEEFIATKHSRFGNIDVLEWKSLVRVDVPDRAHALVKRADGVFCAVVVDENDRVQVRPVEEC